MHIDHFPDGADERVKEMTYNLYNLIEPYLRRCEHGLSFGDCQSVFDSVYKSLDKAMKIGKGE